MEETLVPLLRDALASRLAAVVDAVGTAEAVHRMDAAVDLQRLLHVAEQDAHDASRGDRGTTLEMAEVLDARQAHEVALAERARAAVLAAGEEPGAGTALVAHSALRALVRTVDAAGAAVPLLAAQPVAAAMSASTASP